MADIHAKNILAPKNIKHTEITQGHSHIKIVFQDSLRVSHWEEESLEHLALKWIFYIFGIFEIVYNGHTFLIMERNKVSFLKRSKKKKNKVQ